MIVKKIVDLSWPLSSETSIYPGDPIPSISTFSTINSIGYNLFSIHMGTQTGTHVDAPFHLIQNAKTIDRMPLDMFFGLATVIDVSSKNELELITVSDLEKHEMSLKANHIVLLQTNWDQYVHTDKYLKHPYLALDACEYLISLGVKLICIDTLNLDRSHNATTFPVHVRLAEKNIMVAENMTNFQQIDFKNPLIAAFPLNFVGCDGSPVRAVAIDFCDENNEY